MNVVTIEGLTKKFGNFTAVDNISISIAEGEIYGLLGPNGAGKSTTINILSSLLKADKGRVLILGKDIAKEVDFAKRNTGIVPQDIAIYEELTAFENVKFFAGLYGLKGNDLKEKAAQALEFTGLSERAKDFPKRFSGGMKRRLNIACAIAHKPKLIIMDEPTVGIDPQSRNHILQSIKKLNESGCTIIYTSHYMEEVEEICSRIAIVDHGKVIAEGTKEELKAIVKDSNSLWLTVDSVAKVQEDMIKGIEGVTEVEIDGNIVKVNSTKHVNNLDKIITLFTRNGIPIRNVETRAQNLETVFLSLTGRKLRD